MGNWGPHLHTLALIIIIGVFGRVDFEANFRPSLSLLGYTQMHHIGINSFHRVPDYQRRWGGSRDRAATDGA